MSRRPRTCPRTELSSASASPSAKPFPIHGELLAGVLALLDPLLLLRARLVCAEWCHVISSSRHLWQRVVERQVTLADRARAGADIATEGAEGGNAGLGNAEVGGGGAGDEKNRSGGGGKGGAARRGTKERGGKAESGGAGREAGRGQDGAEEGSGGEEVEGMGNEGVRAAVGMAVGAEQRRRGWGAVWVEVGGGGRWGGESGGEDRVGSVAMRHGVVATGGSDDVNLPIPLLHPLRTRVHSPMHIPASPRAPPIPMCSLLPSVPVPALPALPSAHGSASSSPFSPPACCQTACFPSPASQPITAVDLTDVMLLAASGTQVFAWNKETGKLLRSFGGHHQRIRTISYDDTDLLAACSDGTVHVYDIYSGMTTHILRPHARARGGAAAMSYSSTMGLLLSGGTDGTVRLTDCRSSLQLHTLLFTDPSPGTTCSSPTPPQVPPALNRTLPAPSNRVMAASASGHLRVWDLRSPSHTLMDTAISPPTHTTLALPSSPLALPLVLLTAGATGLVQILDAASLTPLRRLRRPPLAELALGGGAGVAVEVDGSGGTGEGQGLMRGTGWDMREGGEEKVQSQGGQRGRGSMEEHASTGGNGAAAGVSGRGVLGGVTAGVTGIAARTSTFVTSHVDGTATLWFVGL
ncbi:unnamed protein product [Closterium sp. Naga37s-1]|nr:unnamed protein product [Closterium sp. Naga37s-1]